MSGKPVTVKELKKLQTHLQAGVNKVNDALTTANDLGVKVNLVYFTEDPVPRLVLMDASVPLSLIQYNKEKGE